MKQEHSVPLTPAMKKAVYELKGTIATTDPDVSISLRLAAIDNPRRLNQSAFASSPSPLSFALPHGQTVPEVRGLRLSSSVRRAERG